MVNGVAVSSVIASASTIQEVRINQNPYSAEIARPGRGTIEIITKDPTFRVPRGIQFHLSRFCFECARSVFTGASARATPHLRGRNRRPRGTQQKLVVSSFGPPSGGGSAIHRICTGPQRYDPGKRAQSKTRHPTLISYRSSILSKPFRVSGSTTSGITPAPTRESVAWCCPRQPQIPIRPNAN